MVKQSQQAEVEKAAATLSVPDGFEVINTSALKSNKSRKKEAQMKDLDKRSDSEFSIISSQDASHQALQPAAMADSFEHLSQFDPEDEFLKSRTVSVLESVVSGDFRNKDQRSELSDYSIIDGASDQEDPFLNTHMKEIVQQNVNLIRTRRDIYAEDILMTKIIHYVGEFSQDVKSYLSKLRSKDVLMSAKQQ